MKKVKDEVDTVAGYIDEQDIFLVCRHTAERWSTGCLTLLSVNKKKKV